MILTDLFEDIPPPENARKTQIAGTLPTYIKGKGMLDQYAVDGPSLDFGAGLGIGANHIGSDTYEPFPNEKFTPTHSKADAIPDNSYAKITNFNVLNVVPKEIRDDIVKNIGRILKPGGVAIITTRGRDVLTAKGKTGPEPMSIITTIGTYQKGFTKPELKNYVQSVLGNDFEVVNVNLGPAGVLVKKKGITEGTGYIPKNKKEAADPRYSSALSVDVGPAEMQKQAAKFGFTLDEKGAPPIIGESALSELAPVKNDPIFKTAKTEFDKDMKSRSTRMSAFMQLYSELTAHGFKQLGTGSFASTFIHPNYPWVFKIFTYDAPYKEYLDYSLNNQSNPNVPRIKGKYIKLNDNTFVVRLEKLVPISRSKHGKLIKILSDGAVGERAEIADREMQFLMRKYPGIVTILEDMEALVQVARTNGSNTRYVLDVHDLNIMQREDGTPVVTDPIADMVNVWT